MTAEKQTGKAAKAETELPGGGNIDNIREILFGAQVRSFEKRFQRLEESLAKEAADLREELERRLDALEGFAKQETEALSDGVKAEQQERKSACTDLGKELTSLAREVEKKSVKLDEKLTKGVRDLRSKLLEQSKTLSGEIRSKGEGLQADFSRDIEELRDEKTDRAALTALFTEMAMRLSDELRLPGSDED